MDWTIRKVEEGESSNKHPQWIEELIEEIAEAYKGVTLNDIKASTGFLDRFFEEDVTKPT